MMKLQIYPRYTLVRSVIAMQRQCCITELFSFVWRFIVRTDRDRRLSPDKGIETIRFLPENSPALIIYNARKMCELRNETDKVFFWSDSGLRETSL